MLMSSIRFVGPLCLSLLAACASVEPAPPQASAALPDVVATVEPPAVSVAQNTERMPEPTASPVTPTPSAAPSGVKPASPTVTAPTKAPAVSAPPPKKINTAPVVSAPQGPPPLDLKALESKLKETKAIGLFTKLSLKNQVDDLLDEFRAYYKGQRKATLAELRQPYDTLMLKVLALLQDGDPPLAQEISTSREAIWGVLADPVKFSSL
jgi:hypothetical protein